MKTLLWPPCRRVEMKRKPKGQAIMAQTSGVVSLEDAAKKRIVKITDERPRKSQLQHSCAPLLLKLETCGSW